MHGASERRSEWRSEAGSRSGPDLAALNLINR